MNDIVNPVFGNSCGRLYPNKVTLTGNGRQKEYRLDDVKSIKLTSRPKITALFFVVLPLCLLPMPLLIYEESILITVLLLVLALLLAGVAYLKMEWAYLLAVRLKSGARHTIKITQRNVMEAKKFANVVKSYL